VRKIRSDIENWLKEEGERFFKEIGIKKGYIILDFGCGSGNYAIPVAKIVGKEGKVYALDKDTDALNKLIQKIKSMKLENIEIIKTSGELKIPIKDKSVDTVLLYDVLHNHYFSLSERKKVLKEIYRVSKSNALLSVYPMHMNLEEIKGEIKNADFYFENKFLKAIIHESKYTKKYILNFRKVANEGRKVET